jgi:hypothetical protein
MKEALIVLWHDFLASVHWNKMMRIISNTGKPHDWLMVYHGSYASHSKKYNEHKNYLINHGEYITAYGLILNKR